MLNQLYSFVHEIYCIQCINSVEIWGSVTVTINKCFPRKRKGIKGYSIKRIACFLVTLSLNIICDILRNFFIL